MKFKNLFFALAAGVAMTACSSDEPADNSNQTVGGDYGYVSVRLCTPGEMGSRYTDNDKDYNKGTEAESAVTNAMFVFFSEAGNITEIVPNVTFKNWTDGTELTIDKESKTVVKISGSSITPKKVIAILNPTSDLEAKVRQAGNINGVRKISGNFNGSESGKFMMSNSAYKDGSKEVYAATITGKIFDSEKAASEATDNTVDIYVERVLAKVTVTKNTTFSNPGTKLNFFEDLDNNGDAVTVVPVIKGITLINTVNDAHLVKDIDGIDRAWTWNDPTNHRSYWATSADRPTVTLPWNKINKDEDIVTYILPNTQESTITITPGQTSKSTKVIVAAELQVDGKAQNIIRYLDSYFATEADYLTKMAAEFASAGIGYSYKDESNATVTGEYGADDYEIVRVKTDNKEHPYKITAKIKDTVLAAKPLADEEFYNEFIGKIRPAIEWKNGLTYFFAKIEHFGFENQTEDLKLAGVVRNHIYAITLDGLKGLGTPVFDPTENIDPERPENEPESYVSARIAMLKWRVVGQNLTLE